VLLAVLLAAAGCRGSARDPLVTYFNGEHLVSLRYPASWRTEDGAQEGVWFRHFQGPPNSKTTVTATLLAGPATVPLEQYAQSYLAGNKVSATDDGSRQGAAGKRWRYASPDGSRSFSLLLLQDAGHVWGLQVQASRAAFDEHKSVVEEMEKSLTLERPQSYTEYRQDRLGYAIRVPPSWNTGQNFSSGANWMAQFLSPSLAAEKRQTLHASLTLSGEPVPAGSVDAYYSSVRQRLGEAFNVITEIPWRGGRVAVARIETPLAVSRAKRYFWVSGQRGFSLSCEAREDLFVRVTRWCDVIASTLQIDGKPLPAEAAASPAPAASPTPRPALIAR
jgi:hypothetical protein